MQPAGTHFAQQMTLAFSDPGTRVFDRKVASWIFTDLTGRGQSRVRSGDRVNSNVIATEFVVLMLAAAQVIVLDIRTVQVVVVVAAA